MGTVDTSHHQPTQACGKRRQGRVPQKRRERFFNFHPFQFAFSLSLYHFFLFFNYFASLSLSISLSPHFSKSRPPLKDNLPQRHHERGHCSPNLHHNFITLSSTSKATSFFFLLSLSWMAQLLFYDSQRLWPQAPANSKEVRNDLSNALLDSDSNSSYACNTSQYNPTSSDNCSGLNNTFSLTTSTLLLSDNKRIGREGSRVSRPPMATYSRDNRQQAVECGSPKKRGLEYEGLSSEEEGSEMMNIIYRRGGSEKKARRLTIEQVRALEMAFKADNKLEAQRKDQLAVNVGLESRQVAIWFQNRRARWKTKQMEMDYATLKADFQSLRVERDALLQEKQLLQDQVGRLKLELPQGQHSPSISRHPVERELIERSPSSFHSYMNINNNNNSNNNNNMSQDEESLELHMNIMSSQADCSATVYDDDVSEESAIVNNAESPEDERQPIPFMKSSDPSLILHLNDCDVASTFSGMPFPYPNSKEDHGLNEEIIYPFSLLDW